MCFGGGHRINGYFDNSPGFLKSQVFVLYGVKESAFLCMRLWAGAEPSIWI